MKTKILKLLALAAVGSTCLLCAVAQTTNDISITITSRVLGITSTIRVPGVTNIVMESGQMYVKTDTPNKILVSESGRTNIVNSLVANGEFCRVRGHTWGDHMHVTLEYSPSRIGCRECKVCGLHQEQYATEWK